MAHRRSLYALLSAVLVTASGCYVTHLGAGTDPGDGGADVDILPDSDIWPDADRPPDARPDGDPRVDSGRMDAAVDAPPGDATPPTDAGPPPDGGAPDTSRPDTGTPPPPVDAGPPSRALAFERGDRVLVAPSVTLDMTTDHTYELWFRARGDGLVLHKGDVRGGERYHYLLEVSGGDLLAGWATEDGDALVGAPITMGVWTHAAVVVRAETRTALIELFVDGVSVARGAFPNSLLQSLNDQPLLMGAGFVGDIDEVRIFRYARPAAEIAANMGARLSPLPPGLEAYWPLEERGQIVLDRTLRGNEGVLGNLTFADGADPTWITDGPI